MILLEKFNSGQKIKQATGYYALSCTQNLKDKIESVAHSSSFFIFYQFQKQSLKVILYKDVLLYFSNQ